MLSSVKIASNKEQHLRDNIPWVDQVAVLWSGFGHILGEDDTSLLIFPAAYLSLNLQ